LESARPNPCRKQTQLPRGLDRYYRKSRPDLLRRSAVSCHEGLRYQLVLKPDYEDIAERMKGKAIASRLTGISTPTGGISWIPPVNEKGNARRLLVFLEDRRALFMSPTIWKSEGMLESQ